ncbi:hypothetical protein C0Q70_10100 [Pomacea canaliculata]|uniref:Uncharacterized protein n=1 Tax=Pomacea canaliculata TaxID=400727 RepID=A0A2T7PBN0_POMCA|nr:hypothetical protein C0Q70_10100 [Pomacea canaliculata]
MNEQREDRQDSAVTAKRQPRQTMCLQPLQVTWCRPFQVTWCQHSQVTCHQPLQVTCCQPFQVTYGQSLQVTCCQPLHTVMVDKLSKLETQGFRILLHENSTKQFMRLSSVDFTPTPCRVLIPLLHQVA